MKQYKGAVFFVDLLGTGALTQKKVQLKAEDYRAWGLGKRPVVNEHIFCAKLLMKFRSCLTKIHERHDKVKVAQLSDCAFIWSEDVTEVVKTAQEMMWVFVKSGLLCRGGIAYGEIVEPDKVKHSLGQFVLGEAVSKAVGLEGAGKGCRIFCDEGLPQYLYESSSEEFDRYTFDKLRNPLNGAVSREFRWYTEGPFTGSSGNKSEERAKLHKLFELVSLLKHSPLFNWNASSPDGLLQLACSVESISSQTPRYLAGGNIYFFRAEDMIKEDGVRTKAEQSKTLKLWSEQVASRFKPRN